MTNNNGIKPKPGGKWWVHVTARCPKSGSKVHRRRTVGPCAYEDALLERALLLKELKEELDQQLTGTPRATRTATVADYAEHWTKVRVSRLKPSVQAHYLESLASKILPVLGDCAAKDIRRSDIEAWVGWAEQLRSPARQRPYAQDTLRTWWRVLCTLVRDLAADYDIPDPTRRVNPPRSRVKNVRERRTLSGPELSRLLTEIRAHWPEWYAEVFVLAFTGMRAGELYALRWKDVDFAVGSIHVQRAVWQGHEGETKTGDPRVVAMPNAMATVLREHRARVQDVELGPEDLVFPGSTGEFRHTSALLTTLRKIGAVAGLPLTLGPQVLRRTFNTLALEAGVSEIVLRAQMGHTSRAMTERYAGVRVERKQEAVERLFRIAQPKEAS